MKLPWRQIAAVAERMLRKRAEVPQLVKCPVDGTELYQARPDLQICARGHRYGPNEPRGELINQGDHRGPL